MNREQRRAWRRYVFGCTDLTHAQRLVLLALEGFADFPTGANARPGRAALAEMCGLTERAVEIALDAGRRLKLIEQTARANPKRGLAATHRLLPAPISTRTTVRLEIGFNPNEMDFNPNGDDISTRTTVPPTNKDDQAIYTKDSSTCAPVDPFDPLGAEAATPGADLVKQVIPPEHPEPIKAMLRIKASELINTGTPRDIVASALRIWVTKPNVGPGILPSLVSDVIKSRSQPAYRPTRSAVDDKVAGWQSIPVRGLDYDIADNVTPLTRKDLR